MIELPKPPQGIRAALLLPLIPGNGDIHPPRKARTSETHPGFPPLCEDPLQPLRDGVTLCFICTSRQIQMGSVLTRLHPFAAPRQGSRDNNHSSAWHGDGLWQTHLYSCSWRGSRPLQGGSHSLRATEETSSSQANSSSSHLGCGTSPASLPGRSAWCLPGWGRKHGGRC